MLSTPLLGPSNDAARYPARVRRDASDRQITVKNQLFAGLTEYSAPIMVDFIDAVEFWTEK
jgi:hypothetical protein